MGFLKAAASGLFERRLTPPGTPWGDVTPVSNGMAGLPVAGTRVSEQAALSVAAVWACVGVLSDGVATLPLRQYKGDPLTVKTATPMDPSPLMLQPWSEGTLTEFLTGGQVSLSLRGNFYGWVVSRNNRGYPTQIMPLDPDWVQVRRNVTSGEVEYRVKAGAGGGDQKVPREDIIHVKNLMRAGGIVGLNPIEYLRVSLGLAKVQEEFGAAVFANGALPMGVLETEEDLTEEKTLQLARAWLQAHQGVGKAGLPAVLTGGVTWRDTPIKLEDYQFLESRQLSAHDIAMIFRVPPHMISEVDRTTSWGTGIEQQMQGFVRFTLTGYLKRWEDMFTSMLPRGQFVKFDLRALLRPDAVQRSAVAVNYKNAGVMSSNEIRDIFEDLGPTPDGKGDIFLQPLNMGEAGTAVGVPDPGGSK